jgi:hypothetical protein
MEAIPVADVEHIPCGFDDCTTAHPHPWCLVHEADEPLTEQETAE